MINKAKPIVEKLLQSDPRLRDDDLLLWLSYVGLFVDIDVPTLHYKMKDYYYPETISRARRKLQEEKPELLGESQLKRRKLEQLVREEVKDITYWQKLKMFASEDKHF